MADQSRPVWVVGATGQTGAKVMRGGPGSARHDIHQLTPLTIGPTG